MRRCLLICEAGTRRSDHANLMVFAVGILAIHGEEDVNE
jgi:hypothetical protein